MHVGTCRGRKRAWGPLELELQAVVSHLWVMGSKTFVGKQTLLTAYLSLQLLGIFFFLTQQQCSMWILKFLVPMLTVKNIITLIYE